MADTSGGSGNINVSVAESLIAGSSSNGVFITTNGAPLIRGTISNSVMFGNSGTAAAVTGASAQLRIGGSTIVSNSIGVSVAGGATLNSFKNNIVAGNPGGDGTPMTAFPGPGGTALQ